MIKLTKFDFCGKTVNRLSPNNKNYFIFCCHNLGPSQFHSVCGNSTAVSVDGVLIMSKTQLKKQRQMQEAAQRQMQAQGMGGGLGSLMGGLGGDDAPPMPVMPDKKYDTSSKIQFFCNRCLYF